MIVDKGWAVWNDYSMVTVVFRSKIHANIQAMTIGGWGWKKRGYRVLRTTATATVAKKKARKK